MSCLWQWLNLCDSSNYVDEAFEECFDGAGKVEQPGLP
eukprot:s4314_g1.t1